MDIELCYQQNCRSRNSISLQIYVCKANTTLFYDNQIGEWQKYKEVDKIIYNDNYVVHHQSYITISQFVEYLILFL